MTKLLIADDEEDIRKAIANLIDWNANGIEVCGEAEDGAEALELIHKLSPDIVLIDIRMPVMTGLEVIETIHSENLPLKSIIISGYDDMSYAQKALKLGVLDYLLKPCRPEDILETVLSAKTVIESERSKREMYEGYMKKFNDNLPYLRDQYLNRLITVKSKNTEMMLEDFKLYDIGIQMKNVLAAVIQIDDGSESNEIEESKDLELKKYAVRNIAFEILSSELRCEVLETEAGIVIITNVDKDLYASEFLPRLDKIRLSVREYLEFTISIGLGRIYEDICDVRYSYSDALESIGAKFFIGTDSVIEYEAAPENVHNAVFYPVDEEEKILNSIKSGDMQGLKKGLDNFILKLNPGKLSKDLTVKSYLALLFSLYHICVETNTNTEEVFGQGLSLIDTFIKTDTLNRMKDKLIKAAMLVFEKLNSKKTNNKIIEQSLKYISENYCYELSLKKVADSVFVSPRYFCMLFKQTLGCNFIDYIQKLRIEKACELLKDVHLKTYEISTQLGFSDEKYFCQIFKKHKGLTPTQYRGNITL